MSQTLPKIVTRALGKNGPQVPRLGLGLMGLSGHYGLPAPDEERLAFLDKAYEMGETFWDTADMYGDCEDLLGKWFAANPGKRDNIFLSTKFGLRTEGRNIKVNSSPEYCREAIEKSLKRLGLPSVNLFYVHHLDKVTPIEKTMEAMVELKNEGKIQHIGLSECSADSLRRASAIHPIACVQMEYNPFTLEIESPQRRFLETARELGIAVVAYSPLGRGLLTGAIRSKEDITKAGDMRTMLPRFSGENLDKNVATVAKINEIAEKKGVTPSQLTLAWVLAQGDDIFAIPGTTKAERLRENLAAMSISLSAEEEQAIRNVATEVAGLRIPEDVPGVNLFGDTPPLES
ncbi:aldo-keto reductase [Trichoderma reesei QM6a]|uniref:Aldo-keto reductase n=2 Tax=Hypocrea jecorina TaxID=51453 RepID=G0RG55_HYPJQ|nr:aldo-keto reductase [Trichoderma reesei QM6a]EGR49903.1 aldo-keto reductase [Trichoderma reesei QM6a]ETS03229.1 aldo-keto reductase, putative [Trichoderma reesei RUT C-30]